MSMHLGGNYIVTAVIGATQITINPQSILELSIIQDMDKVLPSFHMTLSDPSGILTHLMPFDSQSNTVSFSFSTDGADASEFNSIDFKVYRRKPKSVFQSSMIYDIVGALNVQNYFSPSISRASLAGNTITEFLVQIASELGCDYYDISPTLDYIKPVLQPNWTNAELLQYLRTHLEGSAGEGCYKIFIACQKGKKYFNCLTWNELAARQSTYKFAVGQQPEKDFYPIANYKIYDNYYVLGSAGGYKQDIEYFDYYTSEYVEDYIDSSGMISLTDYFMIDQNDPQTSDSVFLGRSSEETTDFSGRAEGIYFNRMSNMVHMWADTTGQQNLAPGTTVLVMFPATDASVMADYQYNGLWLVSRVMHLFQKSYITRILLTRNGIDVTKATSLLPAAVKSTSLPSAFFPAFKRVPEFTGGLNVR